MVTRPPRRRISSPSHAILTALCSTPTAPFAEQQVVSFVEHFVAERPRLKLTRDAFGNLLISLPTTAVAARQPRWVFTAHMDHPGFVARKMTGPRTLEADFRGGVKADYFKGARVRFFEAGREIVGIVQSFTASDPKRPYPTRAVLKVASPIERGALGMWDLPPAQTRGSTFHSRVCDDLAGAAAALQMLDHLLRRPPKAPIALLLTRAEEEGFIGALAASLHPALLRKTDRLIAIECSAMQPYAPQGAGAIIRVGDRTSVFNSSLTYFLTEQATALAKRDKTFKFQRALMPGGTCEATVYDIYGFLASSICIPLGNYHNMDAATGKIAPEYVDLNDWHSMVALFTRVAQSAHRYKPGHVELKARLERRFAKLHRLL